MVEVIVKVQQGILEGKIATDYDGNTFYAFQSIPYAKPPLGKLRFKDPEPADSWKGVRDATEEGNSCYHRRVSDDTIEGSEDCLFLNVYTPQLNAARVPLSVMFWIHGGGFVFGSGGATDYGPEFLLTRGIVLVTTNYRLGMLGFLQLKDQSLKVPGNAGLKDVVMALQWVKTNIQSFNGDPNNITIFGESAGSAIVQYLMLSPLAKGLFHKAIMESGSVFNPWASGHHGVELYSEALDLEKPDEKMVLEKLQELSVEELYELQEQLNDEILDGRVRPVGPCPEAPSSNAFLLQDPKHILQSGNYSKVPLLIGYNDAEGILSIIFGMNKNTIPVHRDFEKVVPHHFGLKRGSTESQKAAKRIQHFYYGDTQPSLDTLHTYVKLEGDFNFVHAIRKTVENVVQLSQHPVYLYRFCFEGKLNFVRNLSKYSVKGASHADELGYLFNHADQPEIEPGSLEDTTVRRITKLWTNFAKYGNPTPMNDVELSNIRWKPITKQKLNYLNIDQNLSVGVKDDPETERMKFWDSLYDSYPTAKYW